MSSPREDLLVGVEGALKRIKIADGYNTDAGNHVTREPAPQVATEDSRYIAVVWSRQERASDPALVRTHRLTTVHVVAKVSARLQEAQSRLDDIVTDIETAMADQQHRYPVGIQFPQYQSAEPLTPEKAGAGYIGALLTYTSHTPIRRPAA